MTMCHRAGGQACLGMGVCTCVSRVRFAARRAGEVRGCRGQSLAGTGEFGGAISIDMRCTMRRDERTIGKGPVREQHRARTGKTWLRRATGTLLHLALHEAVHGRGAKFLEPYGER